LPLLVYFITREKMISWRQLFLVVKKKIEKLNKLKNN
jgi:hypothetical protein